VKTVFVVAVVAATVAPFARVQAAEAAEVSCRRADLGVALAEGQPALYAVTGQLCATERELRDGATVQLLVHGAAYNHDYWDFGRVDATTYSYARAVADHGIATFALDEIGAGGSSHPPSQLVTLDAAAYVAHEVVRALRAGRVNGTHFAKVITVGHSLGSVVAWVEAIRYADVDGVIVTGAAHSVSRRFDRAVPDSFYEAVKDPRFLRTGLDPGYLTTVPGTRASLFFAAFIPEDEDRKDVVPAGEMASALRIVASKATLGIRVPVLTILGGNDVPTCGPNTEGGYFDCSSGAAVARQEAAFYSRQARIHACVVPNAGHDLNLTLNHSLQVADAVAWSAGFVDPRLKEERRRLNDDAHERGLPQNDGLPWNCGSASPAADRALTVAAHPVASPESGGAM